ncbi:MAG: tetratricopeptide repeat protein [Alphaproteobacteria bacterium]|nr:tetratricopeptide repeat protein [Alphaproteobacteria bacterium]
MIFRLVLVAFVLLVASFVGAKADVYQDFKRGQAAAQKGLSDETLAIFNQVIASGKLTGTWLAYAHFYRGQAHRREGEFDKAISDFKVAEGLAPDLAALYLEEGLARQGQERYADAVRAFDRAATLTPDDPVVFYSRCVAKSWLEDEKGLVADCEKAIALRADFAPALTLLGRHYEDARDCDKAQSYYSRALEAEPGNSEAKEGLAFLEELRKPGVIEGCK